MSSVATTHASSKSKEKKKKKEKTTQSVKAMNEAFKKPPKWKLKEQMREKREKAAKARTQRNRQKMIDNIKSMNGDDENGHAFDSNKLDELFSNPTNANHDCDDNANGYVPWQNDNDGDDDGGDDAQLPTHTVEDVIASKPKKKKRKKKRAAPPPFYAPPPKKARTEEAGLNDADFVDQGIVLTTVHAQTTNESDAQTSTAAAAAVVCDDKAQTCSIQKQTVSQIHRFELTQLMMQNIPRSYDERTLDDYLWRACRVRTEDIHLFHNVRDRNKNGEAVLTFLSPNDCVIAYNYLFGKPLPIDANTNTNTDADVDVDKDAVCSVKPINRHHHHHQQQQQQQKNEQSACKVLKLCNLHWKSTQQDICVFFESLIGVRPHTVRIHITAEGCPNGEAKVEFADARIAQKALRVHRQQEHKRVILGRTIAMEESASRQVRGSDGAEFQGVSTQVSIFNISGGTDESDLRDFIMDTFEHDANYDPRDIHLVHHLQRFTTGYAFVTFGTPQIADRVVQQLNNVRFCGRALRVIWNRPSRPYVLRTELAGKTHILSLTNLRYDVSERDIERFVSSSSSNMEQAIRKIMICENAKGFRYGMAKIWCASPQIAMQMVDALNQKELKGRTVNMNYWNIGGRKQSETPQQQQHHRSRHAQHSKRRERGSNKRVRGGTYLEEDAKRNTTKKPCTDDHEADTTVHVNATVTDSVPSRLLNRLLRD